MQSLKNKKHSLGPQEAADIKEQLQYMMVSDLYATKPSFTADVIRHPDRVMSFSDKHMNYLLNHPGLDPNMYLANLRLKTLIR